MVNRFLETTRLRKDGSQISVSLMTSLIKNSKGEITGASSIAHDTTEQKRVERVLRESEQHFRELAENIHEVCWLSDPENTRMFYISPDYETVWGRSRASLYSAPKSWMDAVHPEDREQVVTLMGSRPRTKPHDLTYRIVRPDGSIRWIRDRGFPVRDERGVVVRFAGVADDITESKQAHEALNRASRQLRILSRRRVEVQEDEKRHLARELHDQIGQTLTAAKISVRSARGSRKREKLVAHLDDAMAIIDGALLKVRQMTLHLRPPALDDLGLMPSLRLVLDDYAKRGAWRAQFIGDANLKRADPEVETACFRIAIEALTNILRHAKARKVSLELRETGDFLHLIVRDDGVGFDVADAEKRIQRDRLGLVSMRERATVVGGKIEYKSAPGQGTEVHASLPLHPA